jgi:transposase
MILDTKNLPNDTKLLHQIIGDMSAKITNLLMENSSLQDQLALLKAKRFGKSSEKLDKQISDLELRIEESETAITASNPDTNNKADNKKDDGVKKSKAKRKPLPTHLPRKEVILKPDPICPSCGKDEFRKIADDTSEMLDYVPASFRVIKTIRPRCACINCEQIVQAEVPDHPISKGKATSSLLSHILVQKYCNHLPYYRQSEIYEREEGILLSRSTMSGWAGYCSNLLSLLVDELKKEIFSSSHIHGDDTIIKVLAPGHGKTKTGRIWTYVRDSRSYDDTLPVAICYFYSPDRKGERPSSHLKDYKGIFHADAYPGYDKIYEYSMQMHILVMTRFMIRGE